MAIKNLLEQASEKYQEHEATIGELVESAKAKGEFGNSYKKDGLVLKKDITVETLKDGANKAEFGKWVQSVLLYLEACN